VLLFQSILRVIDLFVDAEFVVFRGSMTSRRLHFNPRFIEVAGINPTSDIFCGQLATFLFIKAGCGKGN
jgi:hypothetical protein